jgi:hypothetical protein
MKSKKGNAVVFGVSIALLLVVFALFITLRLPSNNEDSISGNAIKTIDDFSNNAILKISDFPESSDLEIDNIQEYESYVSNVNNLIEIFNEQQGLFELTPLIASEENYRKLSKSIEDVDRKVTEWGPLVGNYNEVINKAIAYRNNPNPNTKEDFYISSVKFAFEMSIISGAVFYSVSYGTVGSLYRSSGLTGLARSCPKCVSIALSTTHWQVRNELVELSSGTIDVVHEKKYKEAELNKINFEDLRNSIKTKFWEGQGFTQEQIKKSVIYASDSWIQLQQSENYKKTKELINNSILDGKGILNGSANKIKDWLNKNI